MYEEDIDFVLKGYRDLFGFDLSYMGFRVQPGPVLTDGSPCLDKDPDECGGDWTRLGWIRLNPDMRSVMRRYGVGGDVEEFTRSIIAHELAHELWNNVAGEDFKRDVLDRAESENFSTPYLETVRPSKLQEETFCEYMANAVVRGDGKSGFYKIDARDNVVVDCGDPIGKIGLSFYDDIKALGIGSFEIFPEYRRRGHGEAALRKLVGKYRDRCDLIYCFVDADNAPALALYSKIGHVSDRLNGKGQYMVTFWKRPEKLEFRQVLNGGGELKAILRDMPSYADNPRLDMSQFEKYLADDGAFATLWYGCFDGGMCMALAVLKKYRDDGVILLAEVQSAVKGYGRLLIEDILSRSRNIWWCADPDGGEGLVRYYRRFGVSEYALKRSKWVGGRPETAFYKAEDLEAEQRILAALRAADMESPEYRPGKIQPYKEISFPDEEISGLQGKDSFWTTRVSDDFSRYGLGDVVRAPWGGLYRVARERVVDGVEDHPFYEELTPAQRGFLGKYRRMKVIRLDALGGQE